MSNSEEVKNILNRLLKILGEGNHISVEVRHAVKAIQEAEFWIDRAISKISLENFTYVTPHGNEIVVRQQIAS